MVRPPGGAEIRDAQVPFPMPLSLPLEGALLPRTQGNAGGACHAEYTPGLTMRSLDRLDTDLTPHGYISDCCHFRMLALIPYSLRPPPLPPSDAARLAATCRRFRPLFPLAWSAGSWQPVVDPGDGMVREPVSGQFCLEVGPGEELQAAVDRCPAGGAVLLRPGTYDRQLSLSIARDVHLFGRGAATLSVMDADPYYIAALKSTAPRASVVGLSLRGFNGIGVSAGALRVQHCAVLDGVDVGIVVRGAGVSAAVVHCRVSRAGDGVLFCDGAGGRCEHNDITSSGGDGIALTDVDPALVIAHNRAHDCFLAGIKLYERCPAIFALGPGNVLTDNREGGTGPFDLRTL